MRYFLGLVTKSAPPPARPAAAYALEDPRELAAPPDAGVPPAHTGRSATSTSPARAGPSISPGAVRGQTSPAQSVAEPKIAAPPRSGDGAAPEARTTDASVPQPRPSPHATARSKPDAGDGEYVVRERVVHERAVREHRSESIDPVERAGMLAGSRATGDVDRPAAPLVVRAAPPALPAAARRAAVPPAAVAPAQPARAEVTIAIGTIELRGPSAPAPASPPRAQRPRLTLEEHLAARNGAR